MSPQGHKGRTQPRCAQSCTESNQAAALPTSFQEMQWAEEQPNDTERAQFAMSRMWHLNQEQWMKRVEVYGYQIPSEAHHSSTGRGPPWILNHTSQL